MYYQISTVEFMKSLNSLQCTGDQANIEEALKQGQQLQVAFVCGRPKWRYCVNVFIVGAEKIAEVRQINHK